MVVAPVSPVGASIVGSAVGLIALSGPPQGRGSACTTAPVLLGKLPRMAVA